MRHHFHDAYCEERHFIHQKSEPMVVQGEQAAIGACDGVGATGLTVNQCQFSEKSIGLHGFDDLAIDHDIHLARFNDVHFIALLSGIENNRACGEIPDILDVFKGWRNFHISLCV